MRYASSPSSLLLVLVATGILAPLVALGLALPQPLVSAAGYANFGLVKMRIAAPLIVLLSDAALSRIGMAGSALGCQA